MTNQKSFYSAIDRLESITYELRDLVLSSIPAGNRVVFKEPIQENTLYYSHIQGDKIHSDYAGFKFEFPIKALEVDCLSRIALAMADNQFTLQPIS